MTLLKKRVVAAVLVVLILAIAFTFSACAAQPFRLHIIANSNSAADQQVKLAVRDAVLTATVNGVNDCESPAQAEEYIKDNIDIILKTANETLKSKGFDYRAVATIGQYHFPDKQYKDTFYPEGDYRALRVVLGEGVGENWWCVMFPPLCITELEIDESLDPEDVEYTSLLAELFESIFNEKVCP